MKAKIKTIVPRFSKLHKNIELFYMIDSVNDYVCYNQIAGFNSVSHRYYEEETRPIIGAAEYNDAKELYHSVFTDNDNNTYVLSNELKSIQNG